MSVIDAIGLVSGIFGIIGFLQDNAPSKPEVEGAKIRVKVGLQRAEDDPSVVSTSGDVWAYTYNANNEYMGESSHSHILEGGFDDLQVDARIPGQRAEYVNIVSGYDATCIAWVSVTQYDGSQGSVWTGDVGSACDQSWYYNVEFAGFLDKEQQQRYYPRCTWLDGDHTNDIPSASLRFTALSFNGKTAADTVARGVSCAATRFGYDMAQIDDLPDENSVGKVVQRSAPQAPWVQDQLIISKNITSHSARDLCSSSTSFGPDFVGSDGYYCDMTTKALIPLCEVLELDGCAELADDNKTVLKRTTLGRRNVQLAHKSYTTVKHWS